MRESGYYWVKFHDSECWEIGFFREEDWLAIGSDELFEEEDVVLIGEQIKQES